MSMTCQANVGSKCPGPDAAGLQAGLGFPEGPDPRVGVTLSNRRSRRSLTRDMGLLCSSQLCLINRNHPSRLQKQIPSVKTRGVSSIYIHSGRGVLVRLE